jgi:hypothetical protein
MGGQGNTTFRICITIEFVDREGNRLRPARTNYGMNYSRGESRNDQLYCTTKYCTSNADPAASPSRHPGATGDPVTFVPGRTAHFALYVARTPPPHYTLLNQQHNAQHNAQHYAHQGGPSLLTPVIENYAQGGASLLTPAHNHNHPTQYSQHQGMSAYAQPFVPQPPLPPSQYPPLAVPTTCPTLTPTACLRHGPPLPPALFLPSTPPTPAPTVLPRRLRLLTTTLHPPG